MKRREAPGVGETPLAVPCDRPRRAPRRNPRDAFRENFPEAREPRAKGPSASRRFTGMALAEYRNKVKIGYCGKHPL
ncbi:MAG: hypothetical protein BroJett024_22730 [Alphaproteobacteria bacterium]|nr:MAG: hypothetical protein BroJett024_22730 [Alphaproteobacteria bacterium]